jgi:hypothetical protein
MGRARDLANILSSSGNVALDSELGLSLITPTSVATTGGSNSISTTGAVSFTSASAVSLNGVFSSSYDNYLIYSSLIDTSTPDIKLRLRVNGVDNSSSGNYRFSRIYTGNTSSASLTGEVNQSSTSFTIGDCSARTGMVINIFSPFISELTTFNSDIQNAYHVITSGTMTVTTSYDGFTLLAGSSLTGTMRIYGYRK